MTLLALTFSSLGITTARAAGGPPYMYIANHGGNTIIQATLAGVLSAAMTLGGLLNGPASIALDVANNKMYIPCDGNNTVVRANLDGTGATAIISSGLSLPGGIALDVAGNKMYIANAGDNTISRANLDGTGLVNLGTLNGTLNGPANMTLNVAANKMYVANYSSGSVPNGTISQANLDGTGGIALTLSGLVGGPTDVKLDLTNNKMYVLNGGNNNHIIQANLNGTGAVDLGDLGGALAGPAGIGLDVPNGKMYVVDDNGNNRVYQANLNGTGVVNLGNVSATINNPYAIELDLSVASPEMDLKQGASAIADGGSYGFGSHALSSNTDVVFTIQNTGTASLTLTTPISIGGADAGQFSIQAQPASPVAASGTTTFTVRFTPTSTGAKTATISIANNDSNENPYDLTITGTGTAYSLGNRVWFDTNNDGVLNGAEVGVSGVRVELYRDDGGTPGVWDAGDSFVGFTTTDASGYYRFDNLPAGDYVVKLPAVNFSPGNPLNTYWSSGTDIAVNGTPSDSIGPDPDNNIDSDDNGVTTFSGNMVNYVSSQAVTLGPGGVEPSNDNDPVTNPQAGEAPNDQSNRTVDFGFYRAALSNQIFVDVNNNGAYDGGDTALSGATVDLYASDGTTLLYTTVTGAGGTYLFSGLAGGDYIVKVTPPAGYKSAVDTANTGDTLNPNNNIDNNDNGVGTATGQVSSNIVTLTPGSPGAAANNVVSNQTGTTTDPTLDFGFQLPQADLSITKTDGVTTATPGGSMTYTITASNAGPSNASGATVADTFPAALTGTWTCVGAGGGTCTAAGSGNINDTVNLPAGGSVTYTVSATISAAAIGALSNTATVAAPGGVTDPTPGNNSATDTDTLSASADLAITKTDGVTTATPGGSVTYTITASNAGPSNASGATVADTFPAALTGTWTCVGAGGGTCTASGSGNINDTVNLPASGSVTYTVSATISAAATGNLFNTATVGSPSGVTDPTPGNNAATDTDTLNPQADLAITKTDGVTTAVPGGSVTYTITASNAGPSNASGATVADTFPAALTGTWTCVGAGGGTCTAFGSGNINDTVNLPAGGSVTYTVSASISASATGTLSNTATVSSPGGVTDPTLGNNSATDTDTVACSAAITVTNASDSGAGSLRQAIGDACSGGTIMFDNDYTILLASELAIGKNLTIDGSGHSVTVSGNNATRVMNLTGGTITLNRLTIADGYLVDLSYSGISGAGINVNGATLNVSNSTFSGNTTGWPGGGGIQLWAGTANVSNCAFAGNSAVSGGYGGGIDTFSGTTLNVTNSAFSGNSAASAGGGLSVGGVGNIINSTISGNSSGWAGGGGGINNEGGVVTLKNSIITNNPTGNNCWSHYGDPFNGSSNLANDDTCGAGFANSPSIQLGALGNYGGSTQTFPLLPGSSAIDAGDDTVCAAAPVNGLDQRGVARPQGSACDIGAFESQGFTLAKTGGDGQSTLNNTAFTNPLALSVTSAHSEPVDGGQVTFTAPSSGASTNPATNSATIASGAVSKTVTANGTAGGPYTVTASATGAAGVDFSLTNDAPVSSTTTIEVSSTTTVAVSSTTTTAVSSTTTVAPVSSTTTIAVSSTTTIAPVSSTTTIAVSSTTTIAPVSSTTTIAVSSTTTVAPVSSTTTMAVSSTTTITPVSSTTTTTVLPVTTTVESTTTAAPEITTTMPLETSSTSTTAALETSTTTTTTAGDSCLTVVPSQVSKLLWGPSGAQGELKARMGARDTDPGALIALLRIAGYVLPLQVFTFTGDEGTVFARSDRPQWNTQSLQTIFKLKLGDSRMLALVFINTLTAEAGVYEVTIGDCGGTVELLED